MAFLRLEDFLDNACHQLSLSLVPQGLLFAQVAPPGPCPLTSWAPGSVNVRGVLEIVPSLPPTHSEWKLRPRGRSSPGMKDSQPLSEDFTREE